MQSNEDVRWNLVETVLKTKKIEYELKQIDIKDIDLKESESYQPNTFKLDNETLERYETMWDEGLRPKAIIVWKYAKTNKYIVLDGLTRTHELLNKSQKKIWVYDVQINDNYILHNLGWIINNRTRDQGISRKNNLIAALSAFVAGGRHIDEVCFDFMVNKTAVYNLKKIQDSKERLANNKITSSYFADSHYKEFSKVDDDDVLKRLASLVHNAKIPGDDVSVICRDLKKLRTIQLKLNHVESLSKDIYNDAGTVISDSIVDTKKRKDPLEKKARKVRSSFTSILKTLSPTTNWNQITLSLDGQEELRGKSNKIIQILRKIK